MRGRRGSVISSILLVLAAICLIEASARAQEEHEWWRTKSMARKMTAGE